jgi:hypothetical protein
MPRKRRPSRKRSKRKRGGSSCQDGGRRMRGGGLLDSLTGAWSSATAQLKNAAGEASAAAVRTTDSVKGAVSTVQAGASQTGQDIGERATNLQNVATTGKTTEQLNKEEEEKRVLTDGTGNGGVRVRGPEVGHTAMPVSPTVMPPPMSEENKLEQHVLSNRQNGGKRRKSRRRKSKRRKTRRKSKRRKTRRKSKTRRKRRTRRR